MDFLFKYPRTYHIDFSESLSSDDKMIKDLTSFENKDVVVSVKMDGENFTGYNNYSHARSLDSNNHPSRNWIKGFWAERQYLIPEGWRFCFENLYAEHSIKYNDLETYAHLLNIWDENNKCLSYDETLATCKILDLTHVPVIYQGIYDYNLIKNTFDNLDKIKHEGIVVRLADSFNYNDFSQSVFKAVRANHVQDSTEHWITKVITPNKLKS